MGCLTHLQQQCHNNAKTTVKIAFPFHNKFVTTMSQQRKNNCKITFPFHDNPNEVFMTIVIPVTFLNKYPDFNFYNPKVQKKTTIVIQAQFESRGIPVLNRTSYFM